MTTDELEIRFEAGVETQNTDFKASCVWNAVSFAKDILAMTNVQDGGVIVIGVPQRDGVLVRAGITELDKLTYNEDNMRDQVAPFADPHVTFSFSLVKDKNETEYGIISVSPFQEIPVICRKNSGTELKEAGLYYRNRDKRPQSALVSNSYDMRDIIERSAAKMAHRMKDIWFPVLPLSSGEVTQNDSFKEKMKNELGDL